MEISNNVTRQQFEGWISTDIQAISDCVDRLMNRFNVTAKGVDAIFMTGGSSFVPAIRRIFEEKFGDDTPSVPIRSSLPSRRSGDSRLRDT
jgi:hypothetical chaperone protein